MTPTNTRPTFKAKVAELIAKLNKGESTDFDCPICGQTAIASRSALSGQIRACCPHCKTQIME